MSGQLVEQWPLKKLSEVIEIQNGFAFSSREYTEEGHFLIRIGNVQDGELNLNKPKYVSLDSKSSKFELSEGDLLTSLTGNIGRVARVEKSHLPAALNQRVARMKVSDASLINSEFLYYFLISDGFRNILTASGHGTAQKNVSTKAIGEIEIPIPPLKEQQRIVSILDEAFEIISVSQNNLRNNREEAVNLIKSCVDDAFSGTIDSEDGKSPVVKLGELCDVITKGTTPTSVGYQFVESGINFVKIESITANGEFLEHKFAKITSECHEGLKRSQLRNGDILFSIAGALGRTAYVTESILPANTNQALAIIRLKKSDSVHPQYILKSLSTGFALDQIEKNRAGAAQQNLSLTQMKAFEIPLPPIEVQEQISSKIDIILNNAISLQNSIERKATGYIELKRSILQEAFNGTLRIAEGLAGQS